MRVANCGEDQQSHCRRAGKSVNDSHQQGPQVLIRAKPREHPIEKRQRYFASVMNMRLGIMRMSMGVDEVSVAMRVRVNDGIRLRRTALCGKTCVRNGAQKTGHIHDPQDNQHQPYRQFHAEAHAHWDNQIEEDNPGADHKYRDRVA